MNVMRALVAAVVTAAVLWTAPGIRAQVAPGATWKELDDRAEALYIKGAWPEAIAAARLALAAARTAAERGQSSGRLGTVLHSAGEMPEAEQYLRESLQIRDATFGKDSLEYADAAHDLAVFARDTGRSQEAAALAEQAVAIRRRLPPTDPRLPQALDTYASVLAFNGSYAAALPFFEEAQAMYEAVPTATRAHADYGVLCVNLGGTYQRVGRYQLAETTLAKARAALSISPGTDHLAYIASSLTLAALKGDLTQFQESEQLFNEAITILAVRYPRHPYYPGALNNRGVMYRALGNLEQAEKDLALAATLKTEIIGRDNASTAATLGNLGPLVYRRDRAAGEALLREALSILTSLPATLPYEEVNLRLGLSRAERDRRDFAASEATLRQALAIADKGLGQRHPLRASVFRDLGLTYEAARDWRRAAASLAEALQIGEEAHGQNSFALLPILHGLARVREAEGNPTAALAIHRRSFEIEDRFLNDVFSIGSESFKEAVLASLTDPVHALMGFQSRNGDALPEARSLAFEAATHRKGRVLEQVRHRRQLFRASPTPDTAPILEQLNATTACKTSLTLALGDRTVAPSIVGTCGLPGTPLAGKYERLLSDVRARWTAPLAAEAKQAIDALEEQEQRLEAPLVRAHGQLATTRAVATRESLAARLLPDEVLIEVSVYVDNPLPPSTDGSGIRKYAAFVLDSQAQLTWVDLGEAAPIERAVADLLKAANDWTVSRRHREVKSSRALEATANAALADITHRVWAPLGPMLARHGTVARLRIAPDSALTLVPFEAMASDGGPPLLERFSIAYLPAGRDLLRTPNGAPHQAALVVSAGPPMSGSTVSAREPRFPPLPEATAEARELSALLRAQRQTGSAASEQRVKGFKSPLILHLIGHGRIGDDACADSQCVAPPASTRSAMALSVIVLQETYGPVRGSREDGLLTAIELQDIDLRGTAMLVLSQCRMASGRASAGEGVYGMRRAADIAGAQTFVAPLWGVEDRVQRTLMREFYRRIVAGRDRAEALREAKVSVKAAAATRHFLYWAPVILSGETAALDTAAFRPPRER